MQRPESRWLLALIGLVIIIVVGSVVLFSTRGAKQTVVNNSDTAQATDTDPIPGSSICSENCYREYRAV